MGEPPSKVGEGPADELLVSPAMSFGQPQPHEGGLKAKHPVRIGPLETRGAPPMQAGGPLIEGPNGFSCTTHLQHLFVQAAKCSVFEGTLEDLGRCVCVCVVSGRSTGRQPGRRALW